MHRFFVILFIVTLTVLSGCERKISWGSWAQSWDSLCATIGPGMNVLWDNALIISLLAIFLSAIIGFIIKARAVDKCLKDFANFPIHVITKKKNLQGRLFVYPTGMELQYKTPILCIPGQVLSPEMKEKPGSKKEIISTENYPLYTYILYKNEWIDLGAVYRYQDQLSSLEQKERAKDIKRTYNPSLFRILSRWLRNMLGTFRDAFIQSFSLILGHMKKVSPGFVLLQNREKDIQTLGSDLIGYTGNVFDPILEKYIGRKIVVEVVWDGKTEIYNGILKNYSGDFLEILNVPVLQNIVYDSDGNDSKTPSAEEAMLLQNATHAENADVVKIEKENKKLWISNTSTSAIFVKSIVKNGETQKIAKILNVNEKMEIGDKKNAHPIILMVVRQTDMILPRAHALIRHAGDYQKSDWKSFLSFNFDFFHD